MASLPNDISVSVVTTADPAGLEAVNEQLGALQSNVDKTVADLTGADDEIKTSDDELVASTQRNTDAIIASQEARTGAIEEGAAKASASSGTLTKVLTNPAVLGASVGIYEAIKQAGDFQQQLIKLHNTAGETENYQKLSDSILKVAQDTGVSTNDLTQALYHISSAGYNAAGGIQLLTAAAQGAQEEGASTTDVANALATVMHDYGANANESTQYMNELITATAHGNMTLQDLSSSLSTVLPKAHEAGLSFAQVAGAEATLTEGGVTAQQATQDLSAVIMSLEAPTQQQVKAMQQIGLSSVDLSKNLGKEGLTGTLNEVMDAVLKNTQDGQVLQSAFQSATLANQDLNKEMQAMPAGLKNVTTELENGTISYTEYRKETQAMPESLRSLASEFENTFDSAHSFNQQLINGVNASPTVAQELKTITGQSNSLNAVLMLTGANSATFNANVDAIGNSASNAGKNVQGWSEQQKTLHQQLEDFKESIQTAAIKLGNQLLPIVTDIVKGFNDMSPGLRQFTVDSIVAGTGIVALTKMFGLLKSSISDVINLGKGLGGFAQTANSALQKISGGEGFGGLNKSISTFGSSLGGPMVLAGWAAFGAAAVVAFKLIQDSANTTKSVIDQTTKAEMQDMQSINNGIDQVQNLAKNGTPAQQARAKQVMGAVLGDANSPSNNSGNLWSDFTTGLSGMFASGTNYAPGGWSMVGENGPEAMYVPRGAQILTAGQTSSALATSSVNSNNQSTVSIGQVVLASSSAVTEFFQHIDRDTQLTSMGLSPARGVA